MEERFSLFGLLPSGLSLDFGALWRAPVRSITCQLRRRWICIRGTSRGCLSHPLLRAPARMGSSEWMFYGEVTPRLRM